MALALTVGALAIAAIIFFWVLRLVRSTIKAAFLTGLFLLGLWLVFGIGPMDVWETIRSWLPGFLGGK
ncbi:MAG: hypothetical protein DCF25_19885 [Leptolyngbya foveolarum]|uniref:Uncharacterized protein n=1 Tax=Leptolyngbya foveolarum TaxID=47253 RepID=A0A2W4TW68_9CYAN|nr:MAG: hypothetical protein DCF25_19885 [Leptolyngbya foveolarum]